MLVRFVPVLLVACVLAAYYPVVDYGLWFDDYMDLHPYSAGDIWRALTGHWSVPAWQDNYHRPLTALHNALLFQIFGLNTHALHAVSLVGMVATVWVLYAWLTRDAGWGIALWVSTVYVWHPVLPNSTMAWVSNHKHLYAVFWVVCAGWLWARRRTSVQWRAWWPIAVCAGVGFLFKEDTVMVLPALVVLQAVRARVWADVPGPSRSLVLGTLAVLLALVVVRTALFPYAEALDVATSDGASWQQRLLLGAYPSARALLVIRYDGQLVLSATLFVGLLLAVGGWTVWRRPQHPASWVWIQGAVMFGCFAVPLLLAPDFTTMRAHLLVLSASLMWAGGAVALVQVASHTRARQAAAILVVCVGFGTLAYTTWTQVHFRFGPCGWETRQYDTDVAAWPDRIIEADTKLWLEKKRAACDAGLVPTFWNSMAWVRWRTEDGRVVMVSERASAVQLTVHAAGAAGSVVVLLEGHEVGRGPATPDLVVDVPLGRSWRSRLRTSHRLDVVADVPVSLTLLTR